MADNSFYTRSSNVKDSNRTYIPEIYRQCNNELMEEQGMQPEETHSLTMQNRSIVGVLFSISATADGELFPLYIGRNFIGSDKSCDIYLPERTVSPAHAVILARKQMDVDGKEKIFISITDSDSEYGSRLNDERLDFEKQYCNNGDIITIGLNYNLMLSVFNAEEKLFVSSDFDRIEEKEEPGVNIPASPAFANAPGSSKTKVENKEDIQSAGLEFYLPTKKQDSDHSNNQTIIL